MMKRILTSLLALGMLLCLCACGAPEEPEEVTPDTIAPAETVSEAIPTAPTAAAEDVIDEEFDLKAVLCEEAWINGLGTVIEFYQTGSGRMESPDYTCSLLWSDLGDNAIRLEYDFFGETIADFILEESEGVWTLVYVGGDMEYHRLSDAE